METPMIRTISAEDLRKKIERGVVDIINVLAKEYFDDCHITGSRHVPFDELSSRAQEWDKDKSIVVYCAKYECDASRQAFKQLSALGFENVWAYEGGMKEWKQKGFACQGSCSKEYLT